MPKTYAEAKGRAAGPGRWAKKVPINTPKQKMLKADWILLIQEVLGTKVSGLDKLTIVSLTELYEALVC